MFSAGSSVILLLSSGCFVAAILLVVVAFFLNSLPVDQDLLQWIKEDLGPWCPLALAVSYIPLTVLAVPASVLTLGKGYLFGLPLGFIVDSVGATMLQLLFFLAEWLVSGTS